MQVKKFEAPTIQEALDTIKRELGPEAIILQTKNNRRGLGLLSKSSVEVTAAVSERSQYKKRMLDSRMPEKTKEAVRKMPAARQADMYDKALDKSLERMAAQTKDKVDVGAHDKQERKRITAMRYVDIQDNEVKQENEPKDKELVPPPTAITRAIITPVTAQSQVIEAGAQALLEVGAIGTPALQEAFEQLVVSGMDKRLALNLMRQVRAELGESGINDSETVLDEVATQILKNTEVTTLIDDSMSCGNVIALVGPTGVGKTTTAAKLASLAINRGRKVGLINIDYIKPTSFDQLATYARILNIPFRSVGSVNDLKAALSEFESLDLVIIDTAGRSQRDQDSIKEVESFLKAVPNVRTVLVLSATTRDSDMIDMATGFSGLRPHGLIISKLDETNTYGAVYNVGRKTRLPLLYLTVGQRIPEDIEEARPERVAALIMDL